MEARREAQAVEDVLENDAREEIRCATSQRDY
jgi:hypothetical protein